MHTLKHSFYLFIAAATALMMGACSSHSDQISEQILLESRIPASVQYVKTSDTLSIQWHPVQGAVGYNLYQKQEDLSLAENAASTGFVKLNETLISTTNYTLTFMHPGLYTFGVTSQFLDDSESGMSRTFSVEVSLIQTPLPPSTLSATVTASPLSIDLTWEPSTTNGVLGYNVFRAVNQETVYTKLNTSPITQASYRDLTVSFSSTYNYVIRSIGATGLEGESSTSVVTVTPEDPILDVIRNTPLEITSVTFDAATYKNTVRWAGSSLINAYPIEIQRISTIELDTGDVETHTEVFTQTNPAATAYVDTEVLPGYIYDYAIRIKQNDLSDLPFSESTRVETYFGRFTFHDFDYVMHVTGTHSYTIFRQQAVNADTLTSRYFHVTFNEEESQIISIYAGTNASSSREDGLYVFNIETQVYNKILHYPITSGNITFPYGGSGMLRYKKATGAHVATYLSSLNGGGTTLPHQTYIEAELFLENNETLHTIFDGHLFQGYSSFYDAPDDLVYSEVFVEKSFDFDSILATVESAPRITEITDTISGDRVYVDARVSAACPYTRYVFSITADETTTTYTHETNSESPLEDPVRIATFSLSDIPSTLSVTVHGELRRTISPVEYYTSDNSEAVIHEFGMSQGESSESASF